MRKGKMVFNGVTMPGVQLSHPSVKRAVLAVLFIAVVACGGSDGQSRDVTPDPLNLMDQRNAEPGTIVSLGPFTIQRVDAEVPVAIVNGTYVVGNRNPISEGMVRNGDVITINAIASDRVLTSVVVTITIGELKESFTVTTKADQSPPVVTIHYPPKLSLTTDSMVLVRGVASDDYSAIRSITVNGVPAESSNGFASWTAEIDVSSDDATPINVAVEDFAGVANQSAAAARVIHQADVSGAFPDDQSCFPHPNGLVFHPDTGDLLVSDSSLAGVYNFNLVDNSISVFSDNTIPDSLNGLGYYGSIALDTVSEFAPRVLVADDSHGGIRSIDLGDGTKTLLSLGSGSVGRIGEIEVDPQRRRLIVASADDLHLVSIDLETGKWTVLSDYVDSGIYGLALDVDNQVAYVSGGSNTEGKRAWQISLVDGTRKILSDNSTPNSANPIDGFPVGLALDKVRRRLLLANDRSYYSSVLTINLDSNNGEVG